MTDYTDLKARLRACANGFGSFKTNAGDFGLCDDAAAAITALEDDIARLQTAHVQMQRAMDDLAAENARLRGDIDAESRGIAAWMRKHAGGLDASAYRELRPILDRILTDY